jgi:multiple sugar transport system permease protein
MLSEKPELQRSYSLGNFSFILDYILLHGRAVWNTFVFCLLAVLTHLVVNPLAAYALSRYKLPATGKILLFLLATMAFPAEVTMIPGFLLLRDVGVLHTFAALVLPTAASGYSIYLLKGFFDSLPKDLYENAEMEGARETTMMFRITLPLSKPVMAVIALTSFMAAYSAFMFAFLVAQDERMWTMTVWIYQLQARAPKAVMMAALTLAAIPTLLVFLAAQRVILRGIILPGEK